MSEDERALRTIRVFIALSWTAEAGFLLLGLILFPHNGVLLWRVVWTLGLCGIGMGAAVGALVFLVSARLSWGSRAAKVATATVGALALSACQTLCWALDHDVGLDYWGSIEMPALFLAKGYTLAVIGGVQGAYLLHTEHGARALARVGLARP